MRFHRPSHATVVAYLALLTALGGSAYAASKVGTNDLQPNAVTSPKIAANAVRAGDVKPVVVRERGSNVPAGSTGFAQARCKKRERLVSGGGGWEVIAPGNMPGIIRSQTFDGEAWTVVGEPPGAANTLIATAVCLPK